MTFVRHAFWWLARYRMTAALLLGIGAMAVAVYSVSQRASDNRRAIVRSCDILVKVIEKSSSAQGASRPLIEGLVDLMVKDGQVERIAQYQRNASKLKSILPPDCEAAADNPNYRLP